MSDSRVAENTASQMRKPTLVRRFDPIRKWPKSDTHNLSNWRFKFGIPDTKHGHRSNKNHSKHIISSYGFAFLPLSESTTGLNRDIVSSLCK